MNLGAPSVMPRYGKRPACVSGAGCSNLDPAVIVWGVLVGAALVADVWLIRKGHRSLSEIAGRPAARAVRAGLDLHFDGLLGPVDPLSACARLLRR